MSKVFSAKRKTAEFEYEFLDGKKTVLIAQSLSSKEQAKVFEMNPSNGGEVINDLKKTISLQLAKSDRKTVDRVIDEMYEDGDLIEFTNALSSLIIKEKEKK